MIFFRKRRRPPVIGMTESYIIAELCDWLSRDGRPLGDVALVFLRHAGRGLSEQLRSMNR